ncbi:hypothetical protein C8J56DRAFT_891514 [Mycena floridula]|nr:hypothetical protein C8J56DRAFT_891514 [Mycena floridula]
MTDFGATDFCQQLQAFLYDHSFTIPHSFDAESTRHPASTTCSTVPALPSMLGSTGQRVFPDVSSAAASEKGADDDEITMEDELEENVVNPVVEIRGWEELRKQIQDELKEQSRVLPLSRINQLMIISNFATL